MAPYAYFTKSFAAMMGLPVLTRCPADMVAEAERRGILKDGQPSQRLMVAFAAWLWPEWNMHAPMKAFSMDDPIKRLSLSPACWQAPVERFAWYLLENGEVAEAPTQEQSRRLAGQLFAMANGDGRLSDIADTVRQYRAEEDFSPLPSYARIDFYRSRTHARCLPRPGKSPPQGGEDAHILRMDWQRFVAALPERDRRIIRLRQAGLTLREIAPRIGYKSHTGVHKTLEKVLKSWREQQG
nr:hypothetical protein [bacterium]